MESQISKFAFVLFCCSMFFYSNTIGYRLSDIVAIEYEMPDGESEGESKKLDNLNKDKYVPCISFALFQSRETEQHPDLDICSERQVLISIPTPPPES